MCPVKCYLAISGGVQETKNQPFKAKKGPKLFLLAFIWSPKCAELCGSLNRGALRDVKTLGIRPRYEHEHEHI